ncbi:SDR family oxidoreductase [Anaerovorax odorimutans]|uniref:SDR family oxidoreductase n=1 Tax=Anaerovorax odorimutans TaxID=109327 RepID=A0ABT1RM42_9FIRM|nr:SDR family NAD(P)-dependent oxidoreductase [Anaerovorax odorimutans]MCQ4636256.1 SDR family oxidoreductase [Anaerovorax odorimutans]
MNIKFDYSGKNVVVTGSAKGIGKAIASAYAKAGARVIVADVSEKEGMETAKEICAGGGTANFVRTDVTEEQSVAALIDAALGLYGRIDIMVNNAGVVGRIKGDPLTDLDSEDWDRSYQINLRGVFYCCKAIYQTFVNQGYGNILTIASVAGKTGAPEIAEYSAMKAGVINFTQTLSRELGPKNINVNCICPGFVYTPLYENAAPIYKEKYPQMFKNAENGKGVVDEFCNQLCALKRAQTPADIASAALFLTSDEARSITGQALNICGGCEFR